MRVIAVAIKHDDIARHLRGAFGGLLILRI